MERPDGAGWRRVVVAWRLGLAPLLVPSSGRSVVQLSPGMTGSWRRCQSRRRGRRRSRCDHDVRVGEVGGKRRVRQRSPCPPTAHWGDAAGRYSRGFGDSPAPRGPSRSGAFDSTVKVPTEGSGRTSRHPGRRVPVRSLCDGPGVHSAGGARLGFVWRAGIIPVSASAIELVIRDALSRHHPRIGASRGLRRACRRWRLRPASVRYLNERVVAGDDLPLVAVAAKDVERDHRRVRTGRLVLFGDRRRVHVADRHVVAEELHLA